MLKRRLGRSDVHLSVVGFGTCQLRMVPERQAIETLARGFALGVNWVHASPDYGGVEQLVARAIAESGRHDVIPVTNGWTSAAKMEELFAESCRIYGKERLEVWGISGIDDDDLLLKNNVWGRGGMVELLLEKKRQGLVGATFCSTHGEPEYVVKLIESGAFDAIMLAYNPLGFHALSYDARVEGKEREDLLENARRVFPLAAQRGVSLLVMKPLAGGLLVRSKAFVQHERFSTDGEPLRARDILRTILQMPGVCAVVPGTASPEEAEDNARAGHAPLELAPAAGASLGAAVDRMRSELCSRCGACDTTCSKDLKISWLFREGYVWSYTADTFDAIDRHHYFRLHPATTIACATCTERTCECPHGIDIPKDLTRVHARVVDLHQRGLMHSLPGEAEQHTVRGHLAARLLVLDGPDSLEPGQSGTCRIWLENVGQHCWTSGATAPPRYKVFLRATTGEYPLAECGVRHDVHPANRTFFAFDLDAPFFAGEYSVRYELFTPAENGHGELTTVLAERTLRVGAAGARAPASGPASPATAAPPARDPWRVRYLEHDVPGSCSPGEVRVVRLTLENTGTMTWRSNPPEGNSVDVGVFCDGKWLDTWKMGRPEVRPGERVTIVARLALPLEPGRHRLRLEVVEQTVANFTDLGSPPLVVEIDVRDEPVALDNELGRAAERCYPWHYMTTQGVARLADGTSLPVFVDEASGCRIRDQTGREYVDFTLGWGTTVLGYAHPEVVAAVRDSLSSGALLAYPRPIEIEVTRLLLEDFPGADMASFGKNGSDVCTLAARLCRAFTGRTTLLYCGYHGWGDFWVEQMGFAHTGVPDRGRRLIWPFRFNDTEGFLRLFEQHRHDLAGVMLEPSGPWGGHAVEPDVDPAWLALLRAKTEEASALLVFDEIMTGYRYRDGSVQRAHRVVPDLTCLGKALASGFPLSALVGRGDVLRAAYHRTRYGPTFKSEAVAFAAAKATIAVFRREAVAGHVERVGRRLIEGIEGRLRAAGVAGRVTGPTFRFGLVLGEPDPARRLRMRTLLQQELLRSGVSLYANGVMLPCLAHDEPAIDFALDAFERALRVVAGACRDGSLERRLEIPLLAEH